MLKEKFIILIQGKKQFLKHCLQNGIFPTMPQTPEWDQQHNYNASFLEEGVNSSQLCSLNILNLNKDKLFLFFFLDL